MEKNSGLPEWKLRYVIIRNFLCYLETNNRY